MMNKVLLGRGVIFIVLVGLFCQPILADEKVHTIGIYEPAGVGAGPDIFIKKTKEPVTLILSSYDSTNWFINLDDGAILKKVILNSYEPSSVSILNSDYSEPDVEIDYRVNEKICWPGDSRSASDAVSLNVFPDRQKKEKQMEKFYNALEENTGIVADRENSVYRNSYTSFLSYIVKDDNIKGKGRFKQ